MGCGAAKCLKKPLHRPSGGPPPHEPVGRKWCSEPLAGDAGDFAGDDVFDHLREALVEPLLEHWPKHFLHGCFEWAFVVRGGMLLAHIGLGVFLGSFPRYLDALEPGRAPAKPD